MELKIGEAVEESIHQVFSVMQEPQAETISRIRGSIPGITAAQSTRLIAIADLWAARPSISIWEAMIQLQRSAGGQVIVEDNKIQQLYQQIETIYNHRLFLGCQQALRIVPGKNGELTQRGADKLVVMELTSTGEKLLVSLPMTEDLQHLPLRPGTAYRIEAWSGPALIGVQVHLHPYQAQKENWWSEQLSGQAAMAIAEHDRLALPEDWSIFSDAEISKLKLEEWKNPSVRFAPRLTGEFDDYALQLDTPALGRLQQLTDGAFVVVQEVDMLAEQGCERKIPIAELPAINRIKYYLNDQEEYYVWLCDAAGEPLSCLQLFSTLEDVSDFWQKRQACEIHEEGKPILAVAARMEPRQVGWISNLISQAKTDLDIDPSELGLYVLRNLLAQSPHSQSQLALAGEIFSISQQNEALLPGFFDSPVTYASQTETLIFPVRSAPYALEIISADGVNYMASGAGAVEYEIRSKGWLIFRAIDRATHEHSGFILTSTANAGTILHDWKCTVKRVINA